MAYWNALLQKEVQFRIDQGLVSRELGTKFDSGPIRDNRDWIAELESGGDENPWSEEVNTINNSFTRNVKSLLDFWKNEESYKESDSLLEVAPYTIFWMCCPFLLPLTSEEVNDYCVVGDSEAFNKSDPAPGNGLLQLVNHSIIKDSTNPNEGITGIFKKYFENFCDPSNDTPQETTANRPAWQRSAFTDSEDEHATKFDIHDILCGIARPDKAPYNVGDNERQEDYRYLKQLGIVDPDD